MNIRETIKQINEDFFLLNDRSFIEMHIKSKSVDKKSVKNRSLGFAPATQKSINLKQEYLGVQLPPSYVKFLRISNGFRNISPFLDNLFPIEKVDWTKNTEDQWSLEMFNDEVDDVSDEKYFYYEDDQDPVWSRTRYISESLKISEWYHGMCVFLNPVITFGDEWEVLVYATWYPGIHRYKSFGEFLLKTHASNQRLLQNEEKNNIS